MLAVLSDSPARSAGRYSESGKVTALRQCPEDYIYDHNAFTSFEFLLQSIVTQY
jgi:hypothetical protein